jgi:hypothetical protein
MSLGGTREKFSVDLPEGWENNDFFANDFPIGGHTAFFVGLVDNTMQDPCAHIERSPKIGSTVQDLAAALGEIPDTTATAPVQARIAGHDATYIEVALAGPLPCEEFVWYQESPGAHWWAIEAGERLRVWIIEVAGQRVAIGARSYPDTSPKAKAELEAVLDSIVFDGTS